MATLQILLVCINHLLTNNRFHLRHKELVGDKDLACSGVDGSIVC